MNDLFHQFEASADSAKKKVLRPHQRKAVDLIKSFLGQGKDYRRVVCSMPTGAGKTVTAAAIIEGALSKGNSVIFTAPAISLINQTVAAFEAQGIRDIGVMQANHPRTDRLAKVQVASVQTLAQREIPDAAVVIVDECHVRAEVIDRLMAERPDVVFIGLSATPWRKGMGLAWQSLVVPTTIRELIDQGYLSKFTAFAPNIPDLSGVKKRGGEFVEEQLAELMGDAKILGNIVENWLANGQDRPSLGFGVNRLHARSMMEAFQRAGVASAYVDAFTDSVERDCIGRQFKRGEVRVIWSVRTMTTGVDLPVSCIIDAAPTASEMLHIQKLGRGLRVNPGTEDLVIFDHAGNLLRLGMPDEIEYDELDKTAPGERQQRAPAAERLPKECANCGTLQSAKVCPLCGHERKLPPSEIEEAEGELRQVKGKVARATPEDKQRWYSALLWMARDRGYKDGWAAQKYRTKFGVWPRNLTDKRVAPTPEIANWVKSQQIAWAKSKAKIEAMA